jgi:G:T/U-mismatch repair DNA glycosylase
VTLVVKVSRAQTSFSATQTWVMVARPSSSPQAQSSELDEELESELEELDEELEEEELDELELDESSQTTWQ